MYGVNELESLGMFGTFMNSSGMKMSFIANLKGHKFNFVPFRLNIPSEM